MYPGRNVRRGSEMRLTFASKISLELDVEIHHTGLASEVAP
jgi:hypothetical protein